MLDTLEDKTKEVWMMYVVPKEIEDLAQPDEQWYMETRKNKGTTAGGMTPLAQSLGRFSTNFTLPVTDSIGTWGLKYQEAAGGNDIIFYQDKQQSPPTPPLIPTRKKPASPRWKSTSNSNTRTCLQ